MRRELGKSGIDSECIHLPVPAPGMNYARVPSRRPTIFYSGRLDVEKGVEQLLRAFEHVSAANSDVTLRIAGQGPERSRLESLARELRISGKVSFLGWLDAPEIEQELCQAWVLAAPSLWAEPLGLVALEAMTRGVPVVASAIGGFAETVEEGVSGFLVPNGDVSALADSLSSIVSGREFPRGIASDVVERIKARHDTGSHVERIRATLRDAISTRLEARA